MSTAGTTLGVCFFADRLYYAINDPQDSKHLFRIGSYHFNFDIPGTLAQPDSENFSFVHKTVRELISGHQIHTFKALTRPADECWTILPKVVYDNADEREDYLSILMKGVKREDLLPVWHTLSKNEFKFLSIRKRSGITGFQELAGKTPATEFAGDFEIARMWSDFTKPGGSFLMLGCHKNTLTVTSFLLGKFRAATYIQFDQLPDLPYHWLQRSAYFKWMKGMYENIYLYGFNTLEVEQTVGNYWYSSAEITHLNSLKKIGATADEETYGFDLAAAFPAVMLSLE